LIRSHTIARIKLALNVGKPGKQFIFALKTSGRRIDRDLCDGNSMLLWEGLDLCGIEWY